MADFPPPPSSPDLPDVPGSPEASDVPGSPAAPVSPDLPGAPAAPVSPDLPGSPDVPGSPGSPDLPEPDASSEQPVFRSPQLEDALAAQDVAAVAFALRHGVVVVPRLATGRRQPEQVRVFGRENTDKRILLLFSSADAYAAMVPDEKTRLVMLYDRPKLREFIEAHLDVLEQVFFDIAGPHTMAANPEDLLKALR